MAEGCAYERIYQRRVRVYEKLLCVNKSPAHLIAEDAIHVFLKILDDSSLIRTGQECTAVIELECPYGVVVCLEDGFKVERQSIPECEFSGCGAGEDPPARGRPLVFVIRCRKRRSEGSYAIAEEHGR